MPDPAFQQEAHAGPFDLALFERLNEEYAAKPIVPAAPEQDSDARMKRSRRRLRAVQKQVELKGKCVVEVGCAHGHLSHLLAKRGEAREVVGVDLDSSPEWERFERPEVRFLRADLASEDALAPGSADVVVSNSVLEHVERPLRMLEAIARILRPGGRAWLFFNLHRGPRASHRYREVFFPWPHLLFEPAVCAEYYRRRHGREQTFAWVNRLTAAEYLAACAEAGLRVDHHERRVHPIDVDFYSRFEARLGVYPALDLETDFMLLVVSRARRVGRPPRLGYLERQLELDRALEARPVTSRR